MIRILCNDHNEADAMFRTIRLGTVPVVAELWVGEQFWGEVRPAGDPEPAPHGDPEP